MIRNQNAQIPLGEGSYEH